MIKQAYDIGGWEDLGQAGEGKNLTTYRCISYNEHVCDNEMRLLVLESSALLTKATAALEKEASEPLIKEIEKKEFACEADAQKEYNRFVAQKELKLFNTIPEITRHTIEKWPRGRRSLESKPVVSNIYRVRIAQIGYNIKACRQYIQNESCFVLISNITDETITNIDLLKTYKGQHVVENSFRHLKEPSLASVIYLKNPKRIKGLEMLLNFALLLRAIIQHRLREGLKAHDEANPDTPIHAGWAGRPLKNPTFKLLYEHSINCKYEREDEGEYSFTWPNEKTKQIVLRILSLMGLTLTSVMQ